MELAEMAEMKSPVLRWKTKVGLLWCFSNNNPVVFRLRVAHKVKSLRESIAEISANAKRLGIKLVDVADAAGASQHSTSDHTATSWAERQLQLRRENVDYEGLIGRDRFIDQIKEELRKASNSDKRLTVIGIYGMGGTNHLQFYFMFCRFNYGSCHYIIIIIIKIIKIIYLYLIDLNRFIFYLF